jgi:hypothetical protein
MAAGAGPSSRNHSSVQGSRGSARWVCGRSLPIQARSPASTLNSCPSVSTKPPPVVDRLQKEGLTDRIKQELEDLESLLHNAIVASLANPLIETSCKRMHNYLRLLRLDRKLTVPLALRSLKEHLKIIAACKQRDAKEAEAALQAHFNAALQRHMGLY